ncbi:MAG: DUF3617 domain-containing protein [Novosphingobium sp.]|nr:DUF3617 domain-containing protein [Novosphingobium sp.]
MNRLMLAPLGCLALAACNSQEASVSLTNASPQEVAAAAKKAGVPQTVLSPGQWETKTEIVDMQIPGQKEMPKQYLDQMKSRMATRSKLSCLTKEQVESRDGKIFTGDHEGNCRFAKYEMGNGKIDATMVCAGDRGEMRLHTAGTFSAEAFEVNSEMTGAGAMGGLRTNVKLTGRRVGECPVGSATPAAARKK